MTVKYGVCNTTISDTIQQHDIILFAPDALRLKAQSKDGLLQITNLFNKGLSQSFWDDAETEAKKVYERLGCLRDKLAIAPSQAVLYTREKHWHEFSNDIPPFARKFCRAQAQVYDFLTNARVPQPNGLFRARARRALRDRDHMSDVERVVAAYEFAREQNTVALVTATEAARNALGAAQEHPLFKGLVKHVDLYLNPFFAHPHRTGLTGHPRSGHL